MPTKSHPFLALGAHMSISKQLSLSLQRAHDIGAHSMQIFTANQRQWHPSIFSSEEAKTFIAKRKVLGIHPIMSHGSYLINLGSFDPTTYKRSLQSFREEIQRCQALAIDLLVFHPGAAKEASLEACLEKIVQSLLACQDLFENTQKPALLIENTAGQGTVVGHNLESLAYLVEHTKKHLPIGICLDTCHLFAAGYAIREKADWDKLLVQFDQAIGLNYLKALHLNDSLHPLGSRKDRHAPLGQGHIGFGCFTYIVQSPQLRHLPMYLETPGGEILWKKEIAWLKDQSQMRD